MAENESKPYYGLARIVAGLILFGLAAVLCVLDVASKEYNVDAIQLGLILGTGSILLGVEGGFDAVTRKIGGKDD